MAYPYTAPPTVTDGVDDMTASLWNTYVRDPLTDLLALLGNSPIGSAGSLEDFLLAEHDADGTHSIITATSITTTGASYFGASILLGGNAILNGSGVADAYGFASTYNGILYNSTFGTFINSTGNVRVNLDSDANGTGAYFGLYNNASAHNDGTAVLTVNESAQLGLVTSAPQTSQGYTWTTPVVNLDNSTARADYVVRGNPANLNFINASGAANDKWFQWNMQSTGNLRLRTLNDANSATIKDNIIVVDGSTAEVGLSVAPLSGYILNMIGDVMIRNTYDGATSVGAELSVETYTVQGSVEPVIKLFHSMSNTYGTYTSTTNGVALGRIAWYGVTTDGDYQESATIHVYVNGNNTAANVPTGMVFSINDGTGTNEAMRILATTYCGLNTASPATQLEVAGFEHPTGAVTDGYSASITIDPDYNAVSPQTVTRHNYLDLNNPSLTNVTLTDAAIARFDANAGTHKAVDSGTTKTTPGTVNAWLKWNINGTIYYTPAYTSKTT